MTQSDQSTTKRDGTPFDRAVAAASNGPVPRKFADLGEPPAKKGRCTRCPAPATVSLAISARPIGNPGSSGMAQSLAKSTEKLCEACAVRLFLGATQ